ncbi:hypothetical protein Busp01_24170 [Trinickia caryophylli]|nr:hypothetical protein C0Z17_00845 [Trinickia caryophylli]GLU32575.1 hypothetical protein Busp01_24170 [Trinickia caryophylli]
MPPEPAPTEGLEPAPGPAPALAAQKTMQALAGGGRTPDGAIARAAALSAGELVAARLRRAVAVVDASAAAVGCPADAPAHARLDEDTRALAQIGASLREWVDPEKAAEYATSPSKLLQAVADHNRRAVPFDFQIWPDPALLEDEGVFDAAAVLHRRLNDGSLTNEAGDEACASISEMRSSFVDALREDYAKERTLAALLGPSGQALQETPFFDGFAIRHAKGKSFDDLLTLDGVSRDPAFRALDIDKRRRLLEEKFAQMAESANFTIGSVEHSLATALMRVYSYQRQEMPPNLVSSADLLAAFQSVEQAWEQSGTYPYHPRLLFAAHLARTNDVKLMSPDDLILIYENQVADVARDAEANGHPVALSWIEARLSRFDQRGVKWHQQGDEVKTRAIEALFDALAEAADGDEPIAEFARKIRKKGTLSGERLIAADKQSRTNVLLAYANERALAAFGEPPRFDRRHAAAAILAAQGIDADALADEREYVLASDNPNVSTRKFGSIVDEFLDRADWTGLVGSRMWLSPDQQIVPREALEQAERRFNTALLHDPWVVTRAKEMLRAKGLVPNAQAVTAQVAAIAADFVTETETHRRAVRGFETWIGTVPVAGPLYNIEEGVRHHDAARAALGFLFLGVDLFDLSMSGGGGRSGVAAEHPVSVRFRHATARVDGASVDIATHPLVVDALTRTTPIALRDASVPAAAKPVARRVRSGEKQVRWRDYDVVHLADEDRIIPVSNRNGAFYEVDWRTGQRARGAAPIERDPATGRFYTERRAARPTGASDVEARMTVEQVKAILLRARDASVLDFEAFFDESFSLGTASARSSTFDAKAFYSEIYRTSATFRRLANRFSEMDSRLRNGTRGAWKKWDMVIGDAGPLGSPTKAFTDFDYKRIYIPADSDIEAMPYVTASGTANVAREQLYLQEMIHALTGARDPVRSIDMMNRGAAVYFTDKILSEAGHSFAERVMFRRQDPVHDPASHDTIDRHRQVATAYAQAENRALDPIVDAGAGLAGDGVVEGTEIASRQTVRDAKEIVDAVADEDDDVFLSWDLYEAKFKKNFGFFVGDGRPTEVAAADAKLLSDFFSRLYRRSAIFRRLFDDMPTLGRVGDQPPWKFMLDQTPPASAGAHAAPGAGGGGERKIYLMQENVRYLSEKGLAELEIERRLAWDMVQAMTSFEPPTGEAALTNRGGAVYLTNLILEDAGFHYPRQLVAALVSADDAAGEAGLLARLTAASRSAAAEDGYLVRA